MMEKMNLLFTSAGRRSYLMDYFKEALKNEGIEGSVHAANSSAVSPAFLRADHTVVTPLIYDKAYIPFLLDYCRENRITAVMSLFDADLPVLAAHKADFEAIGTRLLTADADKVAICNDKYKTWQALSEAGIDSPRTYLYVEDVLGEIEKGNLNYPLIVKPRWGTGSISVMIADNETDLRFFYDLAKRKIGQTFLKYESAQNTEACVIIQEMLDGEEYGLDVINDLEGNYVNTIVKKKDAMRSGETDVAITVSDPELSKIGRKLSALIQQPANLDADAFLVDGHPYILELNARFGGGYPFSHVSGADEPRAIVRWLAHRTGAEDFCTAKEGVMSQKDMHMITY